MDKNTQKSEDIYGYLLNIIRESYMTTDRLPPEETLAAKLGISRVKLRDVLAALEANGYINRQKGVGTVINKFLLNEPARLDVDHYYEEMIADSGYRPRTLIRKLRRLEKTPDEIAESMDRPVDSSIHVIEKLIFADDEPVVFVEDYVPPEYYNGNEIDMNLLARSTFRFVQEHCEEQLANMVVHVEAVPAEGKIAEELQLKKGTPILRLNAVSYGRRNTPIIYAIEYLNTKRLPYSIHKRLRPTRYYRPHYSKTLEKKN
jgi:GntR family transcriptional regulator